MKICFISPNAYPLFFHMENNQIVGGSEVQLFLLGTELAKNPELTIYFMVGDFGQPDFLQKDHVAILKSLKKNSVIGSVCSFFIRLFQINADMYIHRAIHPASGWIALICRIFGKKFIYMVAHDEEVNAKDEYKRKFISLSKWMVFRLSDRILCQNTYQIRRLKDKGFDSFLYPNSFPIPKKKQAKGQYILWIGRAESWKRPDLFLDLADQIKSEKFVMICPPAFTVTNLFQSIKERARKIQNLKFIEYIPFSKINLYFEKAKLFVNTSESEGFPNTFIQSAMFCVPIISYKVNPNNIFENQIGKCCHGDFTKMLESVKKLSTDKKNRTKYADLAHEYVKKNHDIVRSKDMFLGFLH